MAPVYAASGGVGKGHTCPPRELPALILSISFNFRRSPTLYPPRVTFIVEIYRQFFVVQFALAPVQGKGRLKKIEEKNQYKAGHEKRFSPVSRFSPV